MPDSLVLFFLANLENSWQEPREKGSQQEDLGVWKSLGISWVCDDADDADGDQDDAAMRGAKRTSSSNIAI